MKELKVLVLVLIFTLFVLGGVTIYQGELLQKTNSKSLVDIIPQVKPSVVHISCPYWQGSGFIISPHIIATARHVVKDVEDFEITFDDGSISYATKAISSEGYDIAFIWVDESMSNVVEIGSIEDCVLGQDIFAIGSPYGQVNFNSVTKGIISGLDKDWDEVNPYTGERYGWEVSFTTDTAGHPGNSGCPIFTYSGNVIGVLVGSYSPVLICAMPVDLFPSLEKIELMFLLDEFYREEKPEVELSWEESLVEILEKYPGDGW